MSELWNALSVWQQTGVAAAVAVLLHLFIKLVLLGAHVPLASPRMHVEQV